MKIAVPVKHLIEQVQDTSEPSESVFSTAN